jgi:hypothetical protein
MTSLVPQALPPFSGDVADFQSSFRTAYLDYAERATTVHTNGVIGEVFSAAEYIALPGVTVAYAPFIDPGPLPQGAPTAALTAQVTVHKSLKADYQAQEAAKSAVFHSIAQALSPSVKARIAPGPDGTRHMTLAALHAALTLHYGRMGPKDINKQMLRLQQPFVPGMAIEDLICEQRQAAALLERNGQAQPEHTRISYLKAALIPSGKFTLCFNLFERAAVTNPAARTFDTLALEVEAAAAEITTDTAGDLLGLAGHAAAAVAVRNEYWEEDAPHQAAAAQQTPARRSQPASTCTMPRQRPAAPPPPLQHPAQDRHADRRPRPRGELYCSTHGYCRHTGYECKQPARNHVPSATGPARGEDRHA